METATTLTFLEDNDPPQADEEQEPLADASQSLYNINAAASNGESGESGSQALSLGASLNQLGPSPHTSYSPVVQDFDQVTSVDASKSYTSQVSYSSPWTPGVNIISPESNVSDRLPPGLQGAAPYHHLPTLAEHEASLMRHFITKLAPIIDICDPKRTFGRAVPRLAMSSPILLNAIFAASSKHLMRTLRPTNPPAEHYIQDCLDHLIPMLNDAEVSVEDHLLVAVVILRFVEEMDSELYPTHFGTVN